MSNFPISAELINTTVRVNVDAQLNHLNRDMNWLAGEVGISTDSLLVAISTGHPAALLWDAAEALGVPTSSLVAGVA